MAHYRIAVIGSQVEQQLEQVRGTLDFDGYSLGDTSEYAHYLSLWVANANQNPSAIDPDKKFACYVLGGKVHKLSFWDEEDQPTWGEIRGVAGDGVVTIVDIHR